MRLAAGQVKADPAMFAGYAWPGRTAGYHRAQVRAVLGFREPAAAMRTSWRVGWPRRCAQPSRTGTGSAGAAGPVSPGKDRAARPSRIEPIVGTAEAEAAAPRPEGGPRQAYRKTIAYKHVRQKTQYDGEFAQDRA